MFRSLVLIVSIQPFVQLKLRNFSIKKALNCSGEQQQPVASSGAKFFDDRIYLF